MLPESIQIHPDPSFILSKFLGKSPYTQIGVLMDRNTSRFCYPLIRDVLPAHQLIEVDAGEEFKNLDTCIAVWGKLTEFRFDRHSLLIVLGGGVLGDLGGFCAATFKRGIDFVLMPTTLLAQVDASVGGKLGIDFEGFKNHIGVFQEPRATLIGPAFLKTLPERELRSGYAEIIKHCLISDKKKWDVIRQQKLGDQNWGDLIRHSVEFKASVTQKDPKEKDLRKILNFGHTFGHAIESHSLNAGDRLFHGEAIAAGMIIESFVACQMGLITNAEEGQIRSYILEVYGKVRLPDKQKILELMLQDKKNRGKKVLLALPKGVGNAVWDVDISEEQINRSLVWYDSI